MLKYSVVKYLNNAVKVIMMRDYYADGLSRKFMTKNYCPPGGYPVIQLYNIIGHKIN